MRLDGFCSKQGEKKSYVKLTINRPTAKRLLNVLNYTTLAKNDSEGSKNDLIM